MAFLISLLLLAPVLILAILIRLGLFAGMRGFVEREDSERPFSPQDLLDAINRTIAQLESRLDNYQRTGGSGTWTARFAASWRRRRLVELRLQRRELLAEIGRWRRSPQRSTAICLERSSFSIRTHVDVPVQENRIYRHDSLE